jgi:hypothetical protein
MALLDEQLVEEWLNRQNFFTIRGIKSGVDEIDLLAIRPTTEGLDCWHVEVQISYRPVGYIGGDTNARKRNEMQLRAGVEQWVTKKFTSPRHLATKDQSGKGNAPEFVFSDPYTTGGLGTIEFAMKYS